MSRFDDANALNNLWQIVEDQYGRWGHWSEAAADTIVEAVRWETAAYESVFRTQRGIVLQVMLAVTWMNESCFNFAVKPNVNNQPTSPWNWDVGFTQMNIQWVHRMAWQGEINTQGLPWKEVFGTLGYDQPFDGNPVTHARCALRRLLATKGSDEDQVVRYTGPAAQPHRLADWRKYQPLFTEFFTAYTS
jgi:hypothetical protein